LRALELDRIFEKFSRGKNNIIHLSKVVKIIVPDKEAEAFIKKFNNIVKVK
jgi:hypothetical protein